MQGKDDKIDILEHQKVPFPKVIADNDKQINIEEDSLNPLKILQL